MTRNNTLAFIVALQIIAAVALYVRRESIVPLPQTRFAAIERTAAADIQTLEGEFQRQPAQWLDLAGVYRTYGLLRQSDYCYQQLPESQLVPDDWFYWGVTLSRLGEMKSATAKYERAISSGSSLTPHCWYMLGRDRLREEDALAAEFFLRKAEDVPAAQIMLSRVLIRAGRADEAMPVLDALLRVHPDSLSANQKKAWAEESLGNLQSARTFDEMSLRSRQRFNPHSVDVYDDNNRMKRFGIRKLVNRGERMIERGQHRQAIEVLTPALEHSWQEAIAFQISLLQFETDDLTGARQTLERIVEMDGATTETLQLLGMVQMRQGEPDDAIETWMRADRMQASRDVPANAALHDRLADALLQSGQDNDARRHAGLAFFERGKIAWRQNLIDEAQEELTQATKRIDDHAMTWFYLGETRRALKQADAEAAYQRCLELSPDHGRALRALANLEATARTK